MMEFKVDFYFFSFEMSEKPLPARFAYDNVEFRNDTVFRHYFVNFDNQN
jgi:hypothetical protein